MGKIYFGCCCRRSCQAVNGHNCPFSYMENGDDWCCCRIKRDAIWKTLCLVPDTEEELSTHRLFSFLLHMNPRLIHPIRVPSCSLCPSHIFPIPDQGTLSSKLLSQKETPSICSGPVSFPWLVAHIQSSSKGVGSIFEIYFKYIHRFSVLTGPPCPRSRRLPLVNS